MEDKRIKLSEKDIAGGFEGLVEKYKWQLGLVFLGLILVGLGVLGLKFWQNKDEGIEIISPDKDKNAEVVVDVQGAVNNPGVYKLSSGSRVNDLLIKAGGLSAKADRDWAAKNLNLAQKLIDGIKIYVPEIGVGGQVLSAEANQFAGSQFGQININTASLSLLETLPGIGPSFAQKIIDKRPYQKAKDLLKVSGIGQKKFEKIKDRITVF